MMGDSYVPAVLVFSANAMISSTTPPLTSCD
jgi:hypothetical protein